MARLADVALSLIWTSRTAGVCECKGSSAAEPGHTSSRLGELTQARTYLQRALALNPHFHLFHADVAARTLTALAEPSHATKTQE